MFDEWSSGTLMGTAHSCSASEVISRSNLMRSAGFVTDSLCYDLEGRGVQDLFKRLLDLVPHIPGKCDKV